MPYARVPRAFIRQTINLGGDSQKVDAAANQFSSTQTANRLVLTIGKFTVTDVFDTNKYAHDPRGDFMNWAIIDTGTFDYAADAWGYTYGTAAEWYQGDWTVRGGVFDQSTVPNSADLDTTFQQFQWVGEVERRYELWGQPGKLAVTGFLTRGRMGSFRRRHRTWRSDRRPGRYSAGAAAIKAAAASASISSSRSPKISACSRAPAGPTAMSSPTILPTSIAPPRPALSLTGKQWGRPGRHLRHRRRRQRHHQDPRRQFLNAGGLGILVGDGMLPHPGPEQIIETYYQFCRCRTSS